jgi:hypothetical protein
MRAKGNYPTILKWKNESGSPVGGANVDILKKLVVKIGKHDSFIFFFYFLVKIKNKFRGGLLGVLPIVIF